jgi:hypothetical protein
VANGVEARRDSTPSPGAAPHAAANRGGSGVIRGGSTHTEPVPPATPRRRGGRFDTGFDEPQPWAWDGGKRREAVLDTDHMPPRIVRRVGWRVCMRCSTPFFSDDVVKIRMCPDCKLPPRGQRRSP